MRHSDTGPRAASRRPVGRVMSPYTCTTCGQEHTDLPHIGSAAPFHWADVLAKDPNSLLTEDLCIIEGRDFFVHGVIEIPVHDYEHEFGWGSLGVAQEGEFRDLSGTV